MKLTAMHEGTLLAYLIEILPQQSRTGIKTMLAKGQIVLNGKSVTAFDQPVKKGDRLEILPKAVSIARATRIDAREDLVKAGIKILYEDEYYLVVDKPSVQGEVRKMQTRIENYLHQRLQNHSLTLTTRLREVTEKAPALSRREVFNQMLKQSEALRKLKEEFQLELA